MSDARSVRTKGRGGFTLIEQMIVIALLGVAVVNIPEVLTFSRRATARLSRSQAMLDARLSLHTHLAHDMPGAKVLRFVPGTLSGGSELVLINGRGQKIEYSARGGSRVTRFETEDSRTRTNEWTDIKLRISRPTRPGDPWFAVLGHGSRPSRCAIVSAWMTEEGVR